MLKAKRLLVDLLKGLPGFHTNRKIVVLESDDWGSIRMPSSAVYDSLLKQGIPVDKNRYNKYDNLADEDDLSGLFEVLTSVKDTKGNPAKLTPLAIVANPDFKKIEESGFQRYYYEVLPDTLTKYGPKHQNAFKLWHEGINNGIFKPQFHGREHLNVYSWMKSLQHNSPETKLAFENHTFGLPVDSFFTRQNMYMSAFEFDSEEEYSNMPDIIEDGIAIFERLFGYKPEAFMSPCAIWSRNLEPVLKKSGITMIQSGPMQYEPVINKPNKFNKIMRYTGQKSKNGQVFSVRNCSFEPSVFGANKEVTNCLSEISKAFAWRKPAVISTHRVNFIGNIVPENRDKGLKQLEELLKAIVKKWPDVEFMTSNELNQVILKK